MGRKQDRGFLNDIIWEGSMASWCFVINPQHGVPGAEGALARGSHDWPVPRSSTHVLPILGAGGGSQDRTRMRQQCLVHRAASAKANSTCLRASGLAALHPEAWLTPLLPLDLVFKDQLLRVSSRDFCRTRTPTTTRSSANSLILLYVFSGH